MLDALNQACINTFGESFTYKGANGDLLLLGVFGDHVQQDHIGGLTVSDRLYDLQLQSSVLAYSGIELRQTVIVRDIPYQIIDIQSDSSGLSTLTLRKYT